MGHHQLAPAGGCGVSAPLTEAQRKVLRVAQTALDSFGLTPLDLLSWEGLLYLREALRDQDISVRIHIPSLYEEIDRALWRKARTLDDGHGADTFHTNMLKTRGIEDRP